MDNIDTYYEELVSLSIQLDCTDDLRVRGAANKSVRICNKLVKLREKIAKSDIDRSELILKLLQHEHEKVRLTACTDGMVYGVHQELIKKELEELYQTSDSLWVQMEANDVYETFFGESLLKIFGI